jgi:Uma2 family endonuclease
MATMQIPPKAPEYSSDALLDDGIFYPDSDGEPVANNTQHYELIATTKDGLERAFSGRDDVFVAADLFWYPVKGNPKIAVAPDVMVAFGRPPGARKSYKQWEENDVPFQVVFEFLSESNTQSEMAKKAMFFDRHGVEEYYLYDMDKGELQGFVRYGGGLQEIETPMNGWISPRLGIRFEVEWSGGVSSFGTGRGTPELVLYYPDGTRFASYLELAAELDETRLELDETKGELDEIKMQLLNEQKRNQELLEKLHALGMQM